MTIAAFFGVILTNVLAMAIGYVWARRRYEPRFFDGYEMSLRHVDEVTKGRDVSECVREMRTSLGLAARRQTRAGQRRSTENSKPRTGSLG